MASSLKFIVLLALVAAVAVVHADSEESQVEQVVPQSGSSTSNDLVLGRREKGDKLVLKQTVKVNSKIGRIVTAKKTFEVGNKEITLVKAMDLASKNGATVEKISGGVGQDSVTLRFKSKRSKGIKFQVQLYAKAGGGSGGGSGESTETEEED